MRYLLILIFIMISSCASHRSSPNKLLSTLNLEDLFNQDFTYNLDYLKSSGLRGQKNIKSISVYRYSTVYEKYLLQDSIILNKRGKPVKSYKPYESNKFSITYFFYDANDNRYLDINIGSYNYDTTYTLRTFDKFNRVHKRITYNATRKEYGRVYVTNIIPMSDSLLNIKYEFYDSNLNNEILPFETRDIKINILNDSVLYAHTTRVVQHDTTYNSTFAKFYKILYNTLIPIDNKSTVNPNVNSSCLETIDNQCAIRSGFEYYRLDENEVRNNFSIDQSIVKMLRIKIDSLPILAWKKYRENSKAFIGRDSILEVGVNTDSIGINEGFRIENFLPQLWYVVSQDSGHIDGLSNECYVVGYNTPLKNESDFNKRCLAIFERVNGKYILRKQTFTALEDFIDDDKDLLFDANSETNFSLDIENGTINVSYEYMRGEASYTFSYENKKWILTSYESSHRTCCEAERYSYNYKTKEYYFSIYSTSEDSERDTTIRIIQERPIMYMDSIYIKEFDYSMTGLIVK